MAGEIGVEGVSRIPHGDWRPRESGPLVTYDRCGGCLQVSELTLNLSLRRLSQAIRGQQGY